MKPALLICSLLFWAIASLSAGDKSGQFEGTISASLRRAGMEATHILFTRKGNLLRIENTSNKLEPVNLLDLATKSLTIVYPHNTTFVRLDLTKKRAAPGLPQLPAGFPAPATIASTNLASLGSAAGGLAPGVGLPGGPGIAGAQVGPNFPAPPGFASPPPLPSVAALPNKPGAGRPGNPLGGVAIGAGVPPGVSHPPPSLPNNPAAAGMPAVAMIPPSLPGMMGSTELQKTEQTKKIQGFDCALYRVSDRGETFEIWATSDPPLPPFRLIERDFLGRRFGPQRLEETWPELLREKSLFPLEAALKVNPGAQERFTFKVEKIEKKQIGDDKVFQPPENYIEIQAPPL